MYTACTHSLRVCCLGLWRLCWIHYARITNTSFFLFSKNLNCHHCESNLVCSSLDWRSWLHSGFQSNLQQIICWQTWIKKKKKIKAPFPLQQAYWPYGASTHICIHQSALSEWCSKYHTSSLLMTRTLFPDTILGWVDPGAKVHLFLHSIPAVKWTCDLLYANPFACPWLYIITNPNFCWPFLIICEIYV